LASILEGAGEDAREIIDRCIKKVNAKLKITNPQLQPKGGRYYLEPISLVYSRRYLARDEWA